MKRIQSGNVISAGQLAIYYSTVLLFLLFSFSPEHRLWGINWWAYFPTHIKLMLITIGSLVPFVCSKLIRLKIEPLSASKKSSSIFLFLCSLLIILAGILFVVFRTQTHFLGDGYQNLVRLIEQPLVKLHELGESLAHLYLKEFLGGSPQDSALLSFRIISIGSGMLFLILSAYTSFRIFSENSKRFLFLFGLVSSGYMLLFFGYVENYSLFVLSVAAFGLTGLRIGLGQLSRFWIIPLYLLTIFFHVLGFVLFPAFVYLLVSGTALGNRISLVRPIYIRLVSLLLLSLLGYLFLWLRSEFYFFRFAFVPLWFDQFSFDGYSLFSMNHIIDYCNLLLLSLPALPLVILFWRPSTHLTTRAGKFLLIFLLSTMAAVFILDPKLGMPRDWDLFSFVGLPLSLLFYYSVLSIEKATKSFRQVIVMAITLNLLILGPRVAALNFDSISIAHYENYLKLDHTKSRNGHFTLLGYYQERNDKVNYELILNRWNDLYPERHLLDSAEALKLAGNYSQAISIFDKGLSIDRMHPDLWQQKGECFLALGMYDSALYAIRVSDGLNPNNVTTLNNLGVTYMYKEKLSKAEKYISRAITLDSSKTSAKYNLIMVYKLTEQWAKYETLLAEVVENENCPPDYYLALIVYYQSRGEKELAAQTYRLAQANGVSLPNIDSLSQFND